MLCAAVTSCDNAGGSPLRSMRFICFGVWDPFFTRILFLPRLMWAKFRGL